MTSSERLRSLIDPAHTVVLIMELQKGIVGDAALLPALAIAVRDAGLLDAAAAVCRGARSAGVRVVHATVRQRADGAGQAINNRIFALAAKRRFEMGVLPTDEGQPGVALVDELDAQPDDIEVPRIHGMTPFMSTSLDQIIRNLGARTIVLMGVSLNLGVLGAALSAVDLGYQVVVVRDAVVGVPPEYGEAVLTNSLAMITTLTTAAEVLAGWAPASA